MWNDPHGDGQRANLEDREEEGPEEGDRERGHHPRGAPHAMLRNRRLQEGSRRLQEHRNDVLRANPGEREEETAEEPLQDEDRALLPQEGAERGVPQEERRAEAHCGRHTTQGAQHEEGAHLGNAGDRKEQEGGRRLLPGEAREGDQGFRRVRGERAHRHHRHHKRKGVQRRREEVRGQDPAQEVEEGQEESGVHRGMASRQRHEDRGQGRAARILQEDRV